MLLKENNILFFLLVFCSAKFYFAPTQSINTNLQNELKSSEIPHRAFIESKGKLFSAHEGADNNVNPFMAGK